MSETSLAAPILGYVGRDGQGLSGIEQNFNQLLEAPQRELPVRRDARGRLVAVSENEAMTSEPRLGSFSLVNIFGNGRTELGTHRRRSAREGGSISLTIDSVIQGIVEEELEIGRREASALRVYGIAMDAESGEILALAQSPQVNLNQSEKVTPERMRNHVLQDSFEPGSTFKPLVAAAALDRGRIGEI